MTKGESVVQECHQRWEDWKQDHINRGVLGEEVAEGLSKSLLLMDLKLLEIQTKVRRMKV